MTSRISVNGISINYRLEGREGAPVVVFSNSLMSNYGMWDHQIAALSGKYRTLCYDQRGHGKTDAPAPPYSIEMFAADVIGLLNALGLAEKVHFVGLSMGGFVGQRLALDYPDRLRSLVLSDTAAHMPPRSLWDERTEAARTRGMGALEQGTIDRWFTKSFQQGDPALVEPLREGIRTTPVAGFVGSCEAIRDMDHRDAVSRIRLPTLVIVGEHDPGTPVAAAEFLHQAIAGSELLVIRDAAHMPNIQQAAIFNDALGAFLGRH